MGARLGDNFTDADTHDETHQRDRQPLRVKDVNQRNADTVKDQKIHQPPYLFAAR